MYTVYKTVNLVNQKFYIGVHKTNDPHDNYLGSGKLLKAAIEKYGVENFTKEILLITDIAEEAYALERELVTQELVESISCYNLKIGGQGGWDFINTNVDMRVAKNRKARATTNTRVWNRERAYAAISQARRREYDSGIRQRKPPGSFVGKRHTSATKRKIGEANKVMTGQRNSQYGTKWITDGVRNRKIRCNEDTPDGWRHGRTCNN